MDFWKFADQNPWLLFGLAVLFYWMVTILWSRFMRHLNVRSKGWPPPHLDADGDFKPKDQDNEDDDESGFHIRVARD